jgi:hypothetical protein
MSPVFGIHVGFGLSSISGSKWNFLVVKREDENSAGFIWLRGAQIFQYNHMTWRRD